MFPLDFTFGSKLAGQLLTWGSCNFNASSWHCLLAWLVLAPLRGVLEDRICSVPRGHAVQVSRWPSDYCFQPILPDHSLTVWTAVSFTSVLPDRIGDFSSALLFAQNINLSLFLTWPAVPSTCACLEQYITLARFCFLCSLQPMNQTFFFLPPPLLGWFSTRLAPGCQLTLNHTKYIILWVWPAQETSDRMRYAPEISIPLASFLSFSRVWGDSLTPG